MRNTNLIRSRKTFTFKVENAFSKFHCENLNNINQNSSVSYLSEGNKGNKIITALYQTVRKYLHFAQKSRGSTQAIMYCWCTRTLISICRRVRSSNSNTSTKPRVPVMSPNLLWIL